MDDFLAKPVNISLLREKLAYWGATIEPPNFRPSRHTTRIVNERLEDSTKNFTAN
jgi:hypothetical protein